MGSIPKESKSWLNVETVTWMYCKSLWIKASAKCINVNVRSHLWIYHKHKWDLWALANHQPLSLFGKLLLFPFVFHQRKTTYRVGMTRDSFLGEKLDCCYKIALFSQSPKVLYYLCMCQIMWYITELRMKRVNKRLHIAVCLWIQNAAGKAKDF